MMQTNRNPRSIDIERSQYKHLRNINNGNKVISKDFSSTSEAILFGVLGGTGIAMFLIAGQLMVGNLIVLKFLKFIALFGVLRYGLDAQDTDKQNNYSFKNGIQFGIFTTASIAMVLAIVNVLIFWVSPSAAFDQFSMPANSLGQLVTSSRIFFFETLVFGITITLIVLQSIKTKL
ncbi:MAG: hypothetical protein AB8F94_01970 [Saprospiraceae bacterium]